MNVKKILQSLYLQGLEDIFKNGEKFEKLMADRVHPFTYFSLRCLGGAILAGELCSPKSSHFLNASADNLLRTHGEYLVLLTHTESF